MEILRVIRLKLRGPKWAALAVSGRKVQRAIRVRLDRSVKRASRKARAAPGCGFEIPEEN